MANSAPTNRREFIGTLAAALPTIGCFKGADLVALAAAEAESGKPVMTPANMNSALPLPAHQHFGPALLSKVKPAKGGPPFRLSKRSTTQSVDVVVDTDAWGD